MNNSLSSKPEQKFIFTEIKIGESYKTKEWILPNNDLNLLLPSELFEGKCHIKINGMTANAKIKIEIRLSYYNYSISQHLKTLYNSNKNTKKLIRLKVPKNHLFSNFIDKYNPKKLNSINSELIIGKSYKNNELILDKKTAYILLPLNEYPLQIAFTIDRIEGIGRLSIIPKIYFENEDLNEYLSILNDVENDKKIDMEIIFDDSLVAYDFRENNTKEDSKITKNCIICGQEINDTNPKQKYCEECEEKINVTKILQNLLKYINPEEKFTIDNLLPHYPKFTTLNNNIEKLSNNNLLNFNPEDNSYSLKDKLILDEFLNKYDTTKNEHSKDTSEKDIDPIKKEYKLNTYKRDMFIQSIKDGKTMEESVEISKLKSNLIDKWLKYGFEGIEPFNNFYNDYIYAIEVPNKLKNKILFYDPEKFNIIRNEEINRLLNKGLSLKDAEKIFYDKYELHSSKKRMVDENAVNNEIKTKNLIKRYHYTEKRHEAVINAIKEGKSKRQAAESAGITIKEIENWEKCGKEGIEPFKKYYEDYKTNKPTTEQKREIRLKNERQEFQTKSSNIKIYLDAVSNGTTLIKSANRSKLKNNQINKWINYGKKGIEPFNNFYNSLNEAKTQSKIIKKENSNKNNEIRNKENNKLINEDLNIKNSERKINEPNNLKYNEKNQEIKEENNILIKKYQYNEERHEIVINAIKEGKTKIEAADLAGITLKNLEHWYNLGKEGIEPFKKYYEDYIANKPTLEQLREWNLKKERLEFQLNSKQIELFLGAIENNRTINQSLNLSGLSNAQYNRWLNYGKQGIGPFNIFLSEYKIARKKSEENSFKKIEYSEFKYLISKFLAKTKQKDIEEEKLLKSTFVQKILECDIYEKEKDPSYRRFLQKYYQLEISVEKNLKEYNSCKKEIVVFLKEIKNMSTLETALKKSNISLKTFNKWIRKGKEGIKPYYTFFRIYNSIIYKLITIKENYNLDLDKQEIFLNEIKNEKNEEEALKKSGLSKELIDNWIQLGELGHDPFKNFYETYELNKKEALKKVNRFKRHRLNQKIFIGHIKNGDMVDKACEKSDLKVDDVDDWLIKGEKRQKPYDKFYFEYKKAKKHSIKKITKNNLSLRTNQINENEFEVFIYGIIKNSSLGIIDNINNTYGAEIINMSSIRLNNNELELDIELKVKKENLDFLKSLVKAY